MTRHASEPEQDDVVEGGGRERSGGHGEGLRLAGRYYREVVRPLLLAWRPDLPHAAARLGSGSDVLGLDDEMSQDHDWGLRLTLLMHDSVVPAVDALLTDRLPPEFEGLPTRFATTGDPEVRHRVDLATPDEFAARHLGIDAPGSLDVVDWLTLTGQSVLEVTAGAVFADTDGRLTALRRRLSWYPDDVWLYVLAVDWQRLGQELPFVGRAGARGDDLGSRVIAARLAGVLMHLGFLLERRWAPYPKWLGLSFVPLPRAGTAAEPLAEALAAATWPQREAGLYQAAERLHDLQRTIGLPSAMHSPTGPFHDRPFRGVRPDVTAALLDAVDDPVVRRLPPGVGSIEQWVDSVDVLSRPGRRALVVRAWRDELVAGA